MPRHQFHFIHLDIFTGSSPSDRGGQGDGGERTTGSDLTGGKETSLSGAAGDCATAQDFTEATSVAAEDTTGLIFF